LKSKRLAGIERERRRLCTREDREQKKEKKEKKEKKS
jgi:hypothetical protein